MKTKIYIISFMTCAVLLFAQCDNIEPSNVDDNKNKATGTFTSDSFDKEKWGDFELVLEMKKSSYKLDEVIDFKLYFSNIGDKTIVLPPINSNRQIENPPIINIWSAQQKFVIDKLEAELENEDDIVIEPKTEVILIEIDLNDYKGTFWQKQNNWQMESGNIGKVLSKGEYYASAFFIPLAHQYSCFTDTLSFIIE